MRSVSTHEAKTHLSALLRAVAAGEEIEILRGDVPVARLVPVQQTAAPGRPRVGTKTSAPISYTEGAFDALTAEELEHWGLG